MSKKKKIKKEEEDSSVWIDRRYIETTTQGERKKEQWKTNYSEHKQHKDE